MSAVGRMVVSCTPELHRKNAVIQNNANIMTMLVVFGIVEEGPFSEKEREFRENVTGFPKVFSGFVKFTGGFVKVNLSVSSHKPGIHLLFTFGRCEHNMNFMSEREQCVMIPDVRT